MDIVAEGTKLLESLSRELRLPTLEFDAEDTTAFVLDRKLVFQLHLDRVTGEVVIGVIFGAMPDGSGDAGLLRRLLGANYYWSLTQGGTIGLDEKSGALVLSYRVPLPMQEPAQIEEIMGKLAGAADYWSRQLAEAGSSREVPSDALLRV